MKSLLYSVMVLCVAFGTVYAQEIEVSAEKEIRFYVDQAAFKNFSDISKTYQEFYVSIDNSQLDYIERGGKILGAYEITVVVKNKDGKEVDSQKWETIKQFDDHEQTGTTFSLEVAGFLLKPGEYDLEITIKDQSTEKSSTHQSGLSVPSFEEAALQLSEIQLARSIGRAEEKNAFVKNNYEVVPNPARIFGIESPFVFSYVEIYNLNGEAIDSGEYTKEYSIVDLTGNMIKSTGKPATIRSENAFWVDKINTIDVASGKYMLNLKVTDSSTGAVAERSTVLWVSNPNKGSLMAQTSTADSAELAEFRDVITYIVKEEDLKNFDLMSAEGKAQFMNSFWASLSPEFRREHLQRFYTAQARFPTQLLAGWQTEQGRVYIMYGPPDELEREPASLDTRAWERWIYDTIEDQSQVEFVFVDFGTGDNYQLIHSTIRGARVEPYDPDWQTTILR